ncbi:MAG TPA: SBBP repeat-containing protein [Ohtaekwangia sp.]|uniref:SBBP repeat-containing protein n=1 Tax=Ohtaekwangia sp. TaxID=2066019 RepID=UPI002F91CDED
MQIKGKIPAMLVLLFVTMICLVYMQSCVGTTESDHDDPDTSVSITPFTVHAGGVGNDGPPSHPMVMDDSGNVYITGSFEETAAFGNTTLTALNTQDIFLVKYNAEGNVVWVKQGAGTSTDMAYSIARDAQNNIYITGMFHESITFDNVKLTAVGLTDTFIAKYTSAGELVWVKRDGGGADGLNKSRGRSITLDTSGNIYIAGTFVGNVVFGTTRLSADSRFYYNMYIAKYNPAGVLQWVTQATGNSSGESIAVDQSGSIYVTGSFGGTVAWGNTTLASIGEEGEEDIFLAKYTTEGKLLWVKSYGGKGFSVAYVVALDAAGDPYITGFFQDVVAFGATKLKSGAPMFDMFVMKCDKNGEAQWAHQAGTEAMGYDLFIDDGNIYLTGSLQGTAIIGSATLNTSGHPNVLVACYTAAGDVKWAQIAGGTASSIQAGNGIGIDRSGSIVIAGYFSETFTVDNTSVTSAGGTDVLVFKYMPE